MTRKTLAVLAIAGLMPLLGVEVSFKDKTVSGTGHVSVLVLPDAATIGLSIEITSTQTGGITAKSSEALGKLGDELAKAGVKIPLIYNGSGTLYGQLNYDSQRFEYKYSYSVGCALDDLSLVEKVLAVIDKYSGDSPVKVTVTAIDYTLKDFKPYLAELREKALKKAAQEAGEAARAYGKSLGELMTVSETPYTANYLAYTPPYTFDFNAQDKAAKSNLPRTTVGIDVIATYELK